LLISNRLERIETFPFRNLRYLAQLALYKNKISYVAEGSLENTNRIYYLQWNDFRTNITQDNMIVCDCSALWLQEYLRSNRPYYETILCGYPIEVRGRRLRSVDITNCTKGLKVSVTPSSEVNYVQSGACLELQCKANQNVDVTWKRIVKGSEQALEEDHSSFCTNKSVDNCGNTDTEGLLVLKDIAAADQGIYVCTATLDNVTSSVIRQIQIGEPPVIKKSPISVVARDPPSYVIFEAAARGNPPPVLKWYHNSNEIDFKNTTKMYLTSNGSLIILGPQFEDNGQYKVVADNGAGSVEAAASLTIYFRSACNRGSGCSNDGQCLPVHYCRCPDGYSGDGCEESQESTLFII
uniref:Ig-like domain-containing protein n=2 Tax=Amphimedon queenslandica TaxID=400682 RepID=A0A1X7SWZ3_AMPQE